MSFFLSNIYEPMSVEVNSKKNVYYNIYVRNKIWLTPNLVPAQRIQIILEQYPGGHLHRYLSIWVEFIGGEFP